MGVTGAGKSRFIKLVTQREDIVVGHGLTSGSYIVIANTWLIHIRAF